ncbi:hypothetical protein ISN44_As10g024420 [Arabidopsis suecica]|uniref:NYN domain-containing protein n=1 Tax=Arabidopsis suecica TaxID=45249 RepID=A0A8T1ZZW5_ARASU|nr:hypothetical protein ISN44_As10g024420 [Arabidopsis suecica]
MMKLRKEAQSKEDAEAKTSVWWDMDHFPVPSGYDAGRIRECIERWLGNLGYCGPVTISYHTHICRFVGMEKASSSSGYNNAHNFSRRRVSPV